MLLKSGLYLVATPIGNLEDITLRALNILKNSDIILCEDSRISQKLLAKHNIATKLQIYNDHSNEDSRKLILDCLKGGKIISLISDAGTPLISDPGYKLVKEVKNSGYFIDIAPGPCSMIAALTLSGLASDRFLFAGFLPKTSEAKVKIFTELLPVKATLIFFESANRLPHTLKIASKVFGNRDACVARELTKLYQEIKNGSFDQLIKCYEVIPPKGEIILLISRDEVGIDSLAAQQVLLDELKLFFSHNISAKSAAEILAIKYKNLYSKGEIYKIANDMKANNVFDLKN